MQPEPLHLTPFVHPGNLCLCPASTGEEAGACAAQVGDDVVDDGMVSDEAQHAQSAWAGWAGQGLDPERSISNAVPKVLPTGHAAAIETPREFNRAVLDFVKRLQ